MVGPTLFFLLGRDKLHAHRLAGPSIFDWIESQASDRASIHRRGGKVHFVGSHFAIRHDGELHTLFRQDARLLSGFRLDRHPILHRPAGDVELPDVRLALIFSTCAPGLLGRSASGPFLSWANTL